MPRLIFAIPARRGTVGLIIVLGLGLSFLMWHYAALKEAEKTHARFLRRAQAQASLARGKLLIYEEMLHGLRSAFLGQQDVSRKEFSHVAREILTRHSGVQALEWVQIVPDENRDAVEQKASAELGIPFAIKRRLPDGTFVPAPRSATYSVILYAEPVAGNTAALGYDLTSAPTATELAESAQDKQLKVSRAIRLAQSNGPDEEAGVVFILPVYKTTVPDAPVTSFVEGIFRTQTILAQAHLGETGDGLRSFYLERETAGTAPTLLYANLSGEEPMRKRLPVKLPEIENPANFSDTIELGNRTWTLVIEMDPRWGRLQATRLPAAMFGAGVAITALLALFINGLLQRTARVERAVGARTAQLKENEARFQSILDHSPTLIFVKDLEGGYILFNQRFEQMCGKPRDFIRGRKDDELFPDATAEAYMANDRLVLEAGRPMEFEETAGDGAAVQFWIVHKFPLRNSEGKPYALCGIATNITDRKRAEMELAESRRQLGNLIGQLPGAAFQCLLDTNLTMLFASGGMLALTGFASEDFVSGRVHLASLTHPDDRTTVRTTVAAALEGQRGFEAEYRIVHRDGRERWILVRGRPIPDDNGSIRFLEGLAIDVTALKHAEAEKIAFERNLLETQKLESLGVLAGGIAHDFNNLLTAILGNATLMRYSLPDGAQTNLEQIERAARRAADLCVQMLAYAGKGKVSNGSVNLSELVRDTTSLLEVSIAKNNALILQLADDLPPVPGDPTQLRQIVMNLVINASEAIGERNGGKIAVTTTARDADPAFFRSALHQPKLPAGRYVSLEVRDNGCGMNAETINRIFEPFFTTKFSGRGLGLSAVLGIVQGHRGALFIESQPDQGSVFRLLLPTTEGGPAEEAAPVAADATRQLSATILIADDEEPVRMVLNKVLGQRGAVVHAAADGRQALELFRRHRDEIDLILLDLTMPGLSGEEILQELRRLDAPQKIIIMSGYSEDETMRRCAELGVVGFIGKPFELPDVVAKLRSYLA